MLTPIAKAVFALALPLVQLQIPALKAFPVGDVVGQRAERAALSIDRVVTRRLPEPEREKWARILFVMDFFESSWQTSPKGYNDDGKACGVDQVHVDEFSKELREKIFEPEWTCKAARADLDVGHEVGLATMLYFADKCGGIGEGLSAFASNGTCPPRGVVYGVIRDRCKKAHVAECS